VGKVEIDITLGKAKHCMTDPYNFLWMIKNNGRIIMHFNGC